MIAEQSTQTAPAPTAAPESREHPTVWGLTPVDLHDRFWAARGVQVVRQGQPSEIVEDAELFLLVDPRLLTIFRLAPLVEELSWLDLDFLCVRVNDQRERGYRERALADDSGRFIRFERDYGGADSRLSRVALTPHAEVAKHWQTAASPIEAWRQLRRRVSRKHRSTMTVDGRTYDAHDPQEVTDFLHELVELWRQPGATIERPHRHAPRIWVDRDATVPESTRLVGAVWVGAGRDLTDADTVVGPAVLWDDPDRVPKVDRVRWDQLEPGEVFRTPLRRPMNSPLNRAGKRAFDLTVASLALIAALPLFPLIMLAIWLEDGRPFLFAHARETLGGRQFPCFKFRSMRKDAEQIKQQLAVSNQVDGPQFYIENDPRITRVGHWLRKFHLDELPQLFNVLAGHMSIVGPRPSPFNENQYCPAWRESRLSVRPGMTGLWQVMRTRREGEDFQEWIRYDIEYVERVSLRLDLWIIAKTIQRIILP